MTELRPIRVYKAFKPPSGGKLRAIAGKAKTPDSGKNILGRSVSQRSRSLTRTLSTRRDKI